MAKATVKSKSKTVVTRSARDLAKALDLSPTEGAEIDIRFEINQRIVEAVKDQGLTHLQLARLARTSRTRMTALLNYNSTAVSTDLMLRILSSLGYRAKVSFMRAA